LNGLNGAQVQTRIAAARGYPLVGVLPELLADPLSFCSRQAARHGGLVRLRLGPAGIYLATHPDHVRHVLADNPDNYWKGAMNHRARFLLGDGLVTSDGELWRAQRRLIQPAFHGRRLAAVADLVTASVEPFLAAWSRAAVAGETMDVAREMQSLSLEIIGKATLGAGLTAGDVRAVGEAVSVSLRHVQLRFFTFFLPEAVRLPGQRRAESTLSRLDALVYRVIAERRASGESRDDLLSMLLEARTEAGEGMSDRQLHDELVTLMVAGGEAPALALAWAWHLLARNPAAEERLHAELDAVLGGRPPAYSDLPRLCYARRVVEEAMRLYPPVWMFFRVSRDADRLGDYALPAGAHLALSPYVTQRDPRFWPDPAAFDPERFTPERSAGRHPFAYYPFGGGPRVCIGAGFAVMEATLVLATLAQGFRARPVPGREPMPQAAASLQPRHGMPMRLETRDPGLR